MSTSVELQKPLTILQNSGMLLAKYYMHAYVNPDLFHLAGATASDPCQSIPRGNYLWCAKLGYRGISLEKVSYRNIPVHHTKQGCFGRLAVRATFCARNFFKKPCTFWEIDIFTCFGPVLYEGSMEEVWLENANLLSEISISGRLVTRRRNFLKKCMGLTTYYALFGQLASRRVRRI